MKPFKLDAVRDAVVEAGVGGMTVTEVMGFGGQQGRAELYRSPENAVSFLPKIKIEILVTLESVDSVQAAIRGAARTGMTGDGTIFVTNVEEMLHVRANKA